MVQISSALADFNAHDFEEYVSNVVPFPKLTQVERDALTWAKAFTSQSSQEQRAMLFRGRVAGYPSALVAFNRPLRPRAAGATANGFHDAEQQFREDAAKRGLIISHLIADGEIHRCDVEGKGGKGDGAYCLHLD